MMGMMMKMVSMVPIAIAGLYILAGKALIISKIALLLAGIIGLKKLVASKQSSAPAAWSSGGGASSGWERSIDAQTMENNHNLAYRAHKQ